MKGINAPPQSKWPTDSVGADAVEKPRAPPPESTPALRQNKRPEDIKVDVEAGNIKVYVAI